MIGLLQRVSEARVEVAGEIIAEIQAGLLVLVGVQRGDSEAQARRLLERILAFRVFPDKSGRMNLDLRQAQGSLLLVPQFTLAADTRSGNRPGFSAAAEPQRGAELFEQLLRLAREQPLAVASGHFGADMQVSLVNDGPVTFWLEVPPSGD